MVSAKTNGAGIAPAFGSDMVVARYKKDFFVNDREENGNRVCQLEMASLDDPMTEVRQSSDDLRENEDKEQPYTMVKLHDLLRGTFSDKYDWQNVLMDIAQPPDEKDTTFS